MLRLDSLEVIGFKSFANKIRIAFPDRITAIIGPNGCGKSNMADALGWVLGIQNARSLRGQKMEDIIFAGTDKRRQSGVAEVRLRLKRTDDSKIQLNQQNFEGDEIEVSRKIYRSGESHYMINQRRCRLMDIQAAMNEIGLGFASYAMIAQGRIESFLSARPLDRRSIIEEAAEILGYKTKRRNAEMKLELAQQNLLRVNDIVSEIERQLRSLKRQANKAKRYRELKEEFRDIQKKRLAVESDRLKKEMTRTETALTKARADEAGLAETLTSKEQLFRRSSEEREQIRSQLNQLQQRKADIRLELDRAENAIRYSRQQIEQTDDLLVSNQAEGQELSMSLQQLKEEREQLRTEYAQLKEEAGQVEERLREEQLRVDRCKQKLEAAEVQLEDLRNRLVQITAEQASLRNLKEQLAQRTSRLTNETQRLQAERSQGLQSLAEAKASAGEKRQRLDGLKGQVEVLQAAIQERQRAKETLETDLAEVRTEEGQLNNRLVGLKERLQSLQELELSRTNYSEGVKKVLQHFSRSESMRTSGTLADSVETHPEFEHLVEEFLDEELEYILVDTLDDAVQGLSEVRGLKSGKCTFFTLRSSNGFGTNSSAKERHPLPNPSEGVYGRLAELLEMKPAVAEAFYRVLPERAEAIVVSDMDRALQLAHSYPEDVFITLGGEALTPRGLLSTSAPGSGKLGLLGLKRQKKDLEQKILTQQKALQATVQKRTHQEAALEAASLQLQGNLSQLNDLEKRVIGVGHEQEEAERDVQRQERAVKVFNFELERQQAELEETAIRYEGIQEKLLIFEQGHLETEERLQSGRDELQAQRDHFNEAQGQLGSVVSSRRVLEERNSALERTLESIESQYGQIEHRLQNVQAKAETSKQRLEQLKVELEQRKESQAQYFEEDGRLQLQLDEVQGLFSACQEKISTIEQTLEELRGQKSTLQEQRSDTEVEHARLETQFQNLEEQCVDQLQLPLQEAVHGVSLQEIEPDAVRREYSELKHRLESFGPINMTALTEYQENEERFEFLTGQRLDLETSISDTSLAIQEINRRSRSQFKHAFNTVNQNFKDVFKKLFGGGDCGMELLDEEDILECGIDVYAQPPGKKLQNVMLLSGGEKALTVFALLVGIFMFRPSRFCILDEVDAPLDDANVKRFGGLISEMSENTQFIIITHNKQTMEIAQTLYGITMEEPGVSKALSAQF